MAEGEYVYCVIPRGDVPRELPMKGFGENAVYTIPFKDLCIVAGRAELKNYKPTDENVAMHRDVSLRIMKEHSVLPVAFGQVFKNRKILTHNLRSAYLALKRSMLAMRGKVELGVKAVIPNGSAPEGFFDGKNLDDARKEIGAEFMGRLKGLSAKEKGNGFFSERLVVNQSYLIDKGNLEKFSAQVADLTKKFSNLKIQYSGPWPPYNFVTIRIGGK